MKKIKQIFSLFLAVVLLLLCVPQVPLTAEAATPASGTCGELAWTLDAEGTLTVSGMGNMPDYTKNGDTPWYASRDSIKKAVISSGVTSIGSAAFYKCEALEEVTIPATVTRIGDAAFMSCSVLTGVTIPDSVTYLGVDAFCYCSSLASVKLSDALTGIESGAFNECLSLTQITIPDSVKSIGEYAFGACPLTELLIPDGVTSIGQGAFTHCEALETISIPDSVVRIGYVAFYNTAWEKAQPMGPVYAGKVLYTYRGDCPETLTVKAGTVGIGDSAFSNQTTLKEIILPDSLVSIGLTSFFKCTALTAIDLPDSLTTIEQDAFQQCSNLADVSFPDDLTWVGSSAFLSTAWYNAQADGPVYIGKVLYKYKGTCPYLVTIQDGTVTIGEGAFNSCDRLTSVEIPASVNTIGSGAFWSSGLTSVDLPDGLTTIGNDAFFDCDKLAAVEIPDSVVYIGNGAFQDCDSLSQIIIGSSVRKIDNLAFALCNNVESLTVPASVQEIGTAALVCQGMTEITFEGAAPRFCVDVEGTGEPIFMDVTATAYYHPDATWTASVLQNYGGTITWVPMTTGPAILASGTCGDNLTWTLDEEGTLTISGTGAMYDYMYAGVDSPWYRDYRNSVKKIVIEEGVTTIGEYAFTGFENLTQIQVGKDLASIEKKAIDLCYSMAVVTVDPGNAQFSSDENGVLFNKDKSTLVYYPIGKVGAYVIPNTVETISEDAFERCAGLTGITIPDSVTKIEGSPFYGCTGLTEVVIPDSVVSMGNAFQNCENLTKVTIGNSVTVLASWLFFGCDALKTVELGNSITTIHEEVFFGAYDLENVILPETVTTIGARSFGSCRSMTKITIPAAVTSIGAVAFGNCTKVTEIYFDGSAPTIGTNAFSGVTATAYYYPDSTWTDEVMQNYGGNITWVPLEMPGDLDGDGMVTDSDVIYLLWHTVFPEDYPLTVDADFNDNGIVTDADVIYLLWHTVFPEDYPLNSAPVFKAGFGMEDISPTASVPLDSYGDARSRMSTGSYTALEARCVAIRDTDGQIMLFLTGDVSWAPTPAKYVRNELSEELGISVDYIVISGTHTHASVACSLTDIPSVVAFNNGYIAGMKAAAYEALEDLKPTEVYVGSVTTRNMNFVRRYIMDDGSLVGDNAYGTGTKIVRHETDADPEMQLMRFVRQDGKDILISQFQAHPHLEGKTKNYSSQTVGAIRDAVEAELGAHSLHWQGASGNLNTHSRISSENKFAQSNAGRVKYGQAMCDYIETVYDDLTKVETGKIQVRKVTYTGQVNHLYDHMTDYAQQIVDYFKAGNSASASATYAHNLTKNCDMRINSYYHANRILANSKLGATKNMDLVAWSFGDVSGVVLPYEMFDTSGMQMKTESPFEKTFIVGYSWPSYGGYIPTREGYANGGYESDNSTFAPGTAEGMVAEYLKMLNDMYD